MTMLIDTGANVAIVSENSFMCIEPSLRPQIFPVHSKLITATGAATPFIGQTKVEIQIDNNRFIHDVLIADIQNDVILGIDFLTKHKCDVLLSKNCLDVQGDKIPCFRYSNDVFTCCRIAVSDHAVVPPGTEIIVPGRPMGHISKSPNVLEPTQHFVEKQGLLIARSLVDPAKGVVPLRVLNLPNEPCKIYKNTIAATCEPVNELDIQVQEMSNETDCHKVCMSKSQNSPKELPPHIQDLYNRSATNLHERECFSLKNLLIQYQDIFFKNDKDIGHTEIIQHTIDTGGVHPIRQKPRRLPLFKMAEAESEIRNMADQGVIEPSTSPWSS